MTKSPKIILAAGALLISYLTLIIGTVYVSQERLHEAVNEQLRLSLEKQATALSYFFSERKNDVAALARDRALETYFASKALGMSFEYGLRASLLSAQEAIAGLTREKRIGGDPIYERMTFIDPTGAVLADSRSDVGDGSLSEPTAHSHPDGIGVSFHAEDGVACIGVSAPVLYKGVPVGRLFGRIDARLVLDQLVSHRLDGRSGHFLLITPQSETGLFLSDPRYGEMPPGDQRFQIAGSARDGVVNTHPLTMVASVAGTSFKLVEIFAADSHGELVTSPWLLVALAGIAVAVVGGLLYLLHINNYSVALHARLQEGQRQESLLALHNTNLRTEIRRRNEAELELIRATEALQTTVGQLEKASLAKSEFLAKMSHELRTPLNAILGFSHCIATEMFGPIAHRRYVEYGGHINESGLHLLDIINDVLDLAKVEAGKKELRETDVEVSEVLNACLRTVDAQARAKGIAIAVEAPRSLPGLRADARLLTQILLNLLSNAIKFTPEGGRVRLAAAITPANEMAFTVADTGVGMQPGDVARALEPFSQIHPVMTTPAQGTGLGLSLVKKFADLHGATMTVDTAVGVGTTVVIRFPGERTILMPMDLFASQGIPVPGPRSQDEG